MQASLISQQRNLSLQVISLANIEITVSMGIKVSKLEATSFQQFKNYSFVIYQEKMSLKSPLMSLIKKISMAILIIIIIIIIIINPERDH
jgi:hypothetical protein